LTAKNEELVAKTSEAIAALERQWQAYLNTRPQQ
jgi:hypothetical protein